MKTPNVMFWVERVYNHYMKKTIYLQIATVTLYEVWAIKFKYIERLQSIIDELSPTKSSNYHTRT